MQAKGCLSKSAFKTFSMRNKGHSTACVLDLSKACTVLGLPIEIQVSRVCMDLPKVCTILDCQRYAIFNKTMELEMKILCCNLTIFILDSFLFLEVEIETREPPQDLPSLQNLNDFI